MRYVILRDDDTNALTPVDCLERLYRPFLDRGLPVSLATIPNVRTDILGPSGLAEGFLMAKDAVVPPTLPITSNPKLLRYLRDNPGYHIVQHGYHHSLYEFDSQRRDEICRQLDAGRRCLTDAGFPRPQTFVAPYDRLSRVSLRAVAKRFRVLSTGWFELRRLPVTWWPGYVSKKIFRKSHWRINQTLLLSHPGCLLSYHRPYATMLEELKKSIASRRLTVLVTHWWEYFRGKKQDEPFVRILHETAAWLSERSDVKVVSFDDVAEGNVPLN